MDLTGSIFRVIVMRMGVVAYLCEKEMASRRAHSDNVVSPAFQRSNHHYFVAVGLHPPALMQLQYSEGCQRATISSLGIHRGWVLRGWPGRKPEAYWDSPHW